ncbi:uncharacterized protein I303_101375 [Kwoniella dejecticola CBS 10117]|uniref:Uncharacterized protein n=1 Tax=Kwoniella dejecticola CBS 10117 TaxID=1296121 RepID=A0A1A6AHM0_9TREE|nr:uncharacterized protein I303_01384 [Kwoniella dejecticola CBS 10117]OBR89556.1 hypothetical protein I303_01384 [Kwoniella dejecticola CBS 10117]
MSFSASSSSSSASSSSSFVPPTPLSSSNTDLLIAQADLPSLAMVKQNVKKAENVMHEGGNLSTNDNSDPDHHHNLEMKKRESARLYKAIKESTDRILELTLTDNLESPYEAADILKPINTATYRQNRYTHGPSYEIFNEMYDLLINFVNRFAEFATRLTLLIKVFVFVIGLIGVMIQRIEMLEGKVEELGRMVKMQEGRVVQRSRTRIDGRKQAQGLIDESPQIDNDVGQSRYTRKRRFGATVPDEKEEELRAAEITRTTKPMQLNTERTMTPSPDRDTGMITPPLSNASRKRRVQKSESVEVIEKASTVRRSSRVVKPVQYKDADTEEEESMG